MSQTPSKCPQQYDPHLTLFSCILISVSFMLVYKNLTALYCYFHYLKKKSFRLGAAVSFLLIIIVKKFFCNNIYYNWSDRRDLDCYGTAHLMKLILSRVLDQIR